ncbi:MFS transporter TsgA [Candidatus Ishikawella capsulata]|uniref:Major facilitator superfamily (MFS) profile domain-containing protein n=1 Tax=Candidatus Ishikawaella capsulata Mpkobe TaxID=476281 RepID=C5WCP5_9ENTR|nr:MFS transporter TsgA [Candidatus Ishikawaella capsulata]BAH83101.1 hypothetical protein ICMP_242 [Candidatus Ishikawaella capsulata Mpkobe]
MTNFNRICLTWISWLSYALTGALVIVTGMLIKNIAQYFALPISNISFIFTFLNAGILIAIFLNAWLMEIIPLKSQLIFGFFLMILALTGLIKYHNLMVFSVCMLILGIISGITMSIGTYLITHLYHGKQRGPRLLFTDSFFSMSGVLFPIITGKFLIHNISWYWVYCTIGIIYISIFLLSLIIEFPVIHKITEIGNMKKEKWGIGVFILSISALCYILGQLSFISWIPTYATENMKMNILYAGKLVGNFWLSYMFGMWFFSFLLKFCDLHRVLVVLTGLSTFIMRWCISTNSTNMLLWLMVTLGFSSSAIYTLIITLGSLQTKQPSPKLINCILTCGTVGTMLTFIVTSPIVAKSGIHNALITSNILYLIVFIMCLLMGYFTKHRQNEKICFE